MRVGFVSDTHGDPTAWEKAARVIGDADLVCHAGDVLYHGIFNPITGSYEPVRLAEALNGYGIARIHARGNCDSEVDQLALDCHILSDFAFGSVDGTRILVAHGHRHQRGDLLEMAARAGADILHVGHSHVPEIAVERGVTVLNAGSCALPKQGGGAQTAAVLAEGELAVYDINTGEKIMVSRVG